jgi:hypothetical protein
VHIDKSLAIFARKVMSLVNWIFIMMSWRSTTGKKNDGGEIQNQKIADTQRSIWRRCETGGKLQVAEKYKI